MKVLLLLNVEVKCAFGCSGDNKQIWTNQSQCTLDNNNNNCLFKVVRNSTKATRQKLSLVTDSAASVCSYDPQFTIDMLRVDY